MFRYDQVDHVAALLNTHPEVITPNCFFGYHHAHGVSSSLFWYLSQYYLRLFCLNMNYTNYAYAAIKLHFSHHSICTFSELSGRSLLALCTQIFLFVPGLWYVPFNPYRGCWLLSLQQCRCSINVDMCLAWTTAWTLFSRSLNTDFLILRRSFSSFDYLSAHRYDSIFTSSFLCCNSRLHCWKLLRTTY